MGLRVFVSGQKAFGAMAARMVIGEGHELAGVCSPAFTGAHQHLRACEETDDARWDRLRTAALQLGVPWTEAASLSADAIPPRTDVILAAHSHAFISRRVRAKARVAIGYHPSLLPLHRGRDAIRWALYRGERVLGGTVYHLTDNVDAGPIAAQDYVIIPENATAREVWEEHLAPMGVRLIATVLRDISEGHVGYTPQDEHLATWEPSWDRPPLHRPDLPELPPAGGLNGLQFCSGWITKDSACHGRP